MEFFSFIREFGSNSGKKLEFLFCRVFKKLGHLQRQICQVAEFFKKSTKIKLDFFENSAKKLEFCSVWVGPDFLPFLPSHFTDMTSVCKDGFACYLRNGWFAHKYQIHEMHVYLFRAQAFYSVL